MNIEFTIPKKRPYKNVYLLKISLTETKIWRRIIVPESYTFYELHVAIQNAMGWTDSHLHCFEKRESNKKYFSRRTLVIDCPYSIEEYKHDVPTLYVTETPITNIFKEIGDFIFYLYDFGDNWEHKVVLEKIIYKDYKLKYPICLSGKLACPPEDCGGIPGYYECIEASNGKGSQELGDWIGDWNPDFFDPKEVVFNNPRQRFLETMDL